MAKENIMEVMILVIIMLTVRKQPELSSPLRFSGNPWQCCFKKSLGTQRKWKWKDFFCVDLTSDWLFSSSVSENSREAADFKKKKNVSKANDNIAYTLTKKEI